MARQELERLLQELAQAVSSDSQSGSKGQTEAIPTAASPQSGIEQLTQLLGSEHQQADWAVSKAPKKRDDHKVKSVEGDCLLLDGQLQPERQHGNAPEPAPAGAQDHQLDHRGARSWIFGLRRSLAVTAMGITLLAPGSGALVLLRQYPDTSVVVTAAIPPRVSQPERGATEPVSIIPPGNIVNAAPTEGKGEVITAPKPAPEAPTPTALLESHPKEDAAAAPSTASHNVVESAPGLGTEEAAALVLRGDAQFKLGDIGTARLLYERAAGAGNADAALRMGQTFDPAFLAQTGLRSIRGDPFTAVSWYMRADKLGAADAAGLLRALAVDIGLSRSPQQTGRARATGKN